MVENPRPDRTSQNQRKRRDDRAVTRKHDHIPPAGPHARPELTNPDLTPGTGVLPNDDNDANPQPTG